MKSRLLPAVLLSVALLFASASSLNAQYFISAQLVPTSTPPGQVVTADFNGDGRPDLAFGSGLVELAGPNRSFTVAQQIAGVTEGFPVAGDFNRDGVTDLAFAFVTNDLTTVSIFEGEGNGTFLPGATYTGINAFAYGLAAADLNGDGNPDLLIADYFSTIQVLLGQGNGKFGPAVPYTLATANVNNVTAADLNGDGNLDVIAAVNVINKSQGQVVVLLGNGDGTLQAPTSYVVPVIAESVAVADLNHDGIPDVAASAIGLAVLLGSGDGTLQPAKVFPTFDTSNTYEVQIADVNQDGTPDVIVVLYDAIVDIFYGRGDGNFSGPLGFGTSACPHATAVADFNLDGIFDIAVSGDFDNEFSVLYGDRAGRFAASRLYSAQIQDPLNFLLGLAPGDVNRDGNVDLAGVLSATSQVIIFPGTRHGTFATHLTIPAAPGAGAIALGDLNLDKYDDIVTASSSSDMMSVMLNNRDGTFQSHVDYSTLSEPRLVLLGDVNADGKLDVIIAGKTYINVFLNDGSGEFPTRVDTTLPVTGWPYYVAAGDFNGDGYLDLVSTQQAKPTQATTVFLGDGQGHFTAKQNLQALAPFSVTVGDVNGDGKLDVVTPTLGNNIYVFLGAGDGTFLDPVISKTLSIPDYIALADFNHDGKLDAVVRGGQLDLQYGNGDGTFGSPETYPTAASFAPVIGDFNHDGAPDVANNAGVGVSVLLGRSTK